MMRSITPGQAIGPHAQYVPSKAFGDTDDLPNGALRSPRLSIAAGSSTVSGVVKDTTTGSPVANAQVGISNGTVGGGAQYTTTASDGSYSFTGIAAGTYNLAADRYTINSTQPFYKDAQQMQVTVSGSATANFSLTPISVSGSRTIPAGRAKNLIIVDYDETYYESWFSDTQSMANNSPATHQLAQHGVVAPETWTQYGWSPIDHYQIAVGSYPAWRAPDAPAKAWGQPDGLDTNIWYSGTEVFGQEGSNLIQNGGFESSSGWVYGGTPHPRRSQTVSHSGRYSLKFGYRSGQEGDSIAYQMVTIPSSARNATLSFYYWPASNDSSTYGWQEADVIDSSGNVLQQLFVNTTNDNVWVQLTFDLSAYAGKTVGIQFLDHEESGGGPYYTYMYVDDVSLIVS